MHTEQIFSQCLSKKEVQPKKDTQKTSMSPKVEEVKVPMTEEVKMSPEPKVKKVDSPKPELKKFLLLDVMSFYRFFLSPIFWQLEKSRLRVQMFVDAAKGSGYDLEVFFEDSILSEEKQLGIWKRIRAREISNGQYTNYGCFAQILGQYFREAGVEVTYSDGDKTDVMAFLAQKYGGLILSTDPKSFLTYKDHKF